jgi:uncharacterized membrane protein
MDHAGNDDERATDRASDSQPPGRIELALAATLSALEAHLSQIDQTTAALDQRLHAVEHRLGIAQPIAPAMPTIATPERRDDAPVNRSAPTPESRPASRESRTVLAAAHALFDGTPTSGRPTRLAAPLPVASAPASPPPAKPRRRMASMEDLERAVSGRGLAWAGGLALLLGALFFFSLAISRGWIGPELRVVIGLVAGLTVTGMGDRLLRGGDRLLGPVLVAVGIGIWNLALVAGTRLYDFAFLPAWAALLGAAAGAVVATAIAIRANAQVIALYGMVTALAAPILFGIPSARLSMAYLVVLLVGSTAVALARGWSWLPPVAFVLSEAQFFGWWGSTAATTGMTVLAIVSLSLLHLIAATGVELRATGHRARGSALAVLVLNAIAFATVGFDELLRQEIPLGLYLVGGAAAHAAVGRVVLGRKGLATAFVRAAFALAVIFVTLAFAVVFDGAPMALAWTAEAVILIWLAQRFQNAGWFGGGAAVFALATAYLFIGEYGAFGLGAASRPGDGIPFANEAGLILLGLLAALALVALRAPSIVDPRSCAAVGFSLVIAALPFELSGLWLLAGWAALAVLALAAERLFAGLGDVGEFVPTRVRFITADLKLPAVIAAGLAVYRAVFYEMPVLAPAPFEAGVPYVGQPVPATIIVVLAALATAAVTRATEVRLIAGSVAILTTANLAAYSLNSAHTVAAWAALAVVAVWLQRRASATVRVSLLTGSFLLVLGTGLALTDVAPPSRLLVSSGVVIDHPLLWSEATLALGALAVAFLVTAWMAQGDRASGWLALGAGVLALYLVSVGIVDEFQRRVGGTVSVAELRRQSQVALSVVWAVLGGAVVAVGLDRQLAPLRWFGLGLLALTTAKVFLYDFASLDAVYRVLSFIVLGILLLLSAYAYRRLGGVAEDGRAA